VPRLADRREVLSVRAEGDCGAEHGARYHVEGVVPGVHDTGYGHEARGEGGDEDYEGLPDFAAGVEDVEFCGEVEGQVDETSEGGWARRMGGMLVGVIVSRVGSVVGCQSRPRGI
jgi:hypothetical protein